MWFTILCEKIGFTKRNLRRLRGLIGRIARAIEHFWLPESKLGCAIGIIAVILAIGVYLVVAVTTEFTLVNFFITAILMFCVFFASLLILGALSSGIRIAAQKTWASIPEDSRKTKPKRGEQGIQALSNDTDASDENDTDDLLYSAGTMRHR